MAGKLDSLSPLGVLARGYSVTQRLDGARVVRNVDELQVGDQLITRFSHGRAISRVEQLDRGAAK